MSKLLTGQQILRRMETVFFGFRRGTHDGNTVYGTLKNGERAKITVQVNSTDETTTVTMRLPENEALGTGFQIFSADATPKFVKQNIADAVKAQDLGTKRWAAVNA